MSEYYNLETCTEDGTRLRTKVRNFCVLGDGLHEDGGTVTVARTDGRVIGSAVVYYEEQKL
jgi:hypothetical protein